MTANALSVTLFVPSGSTASMSSRFRQFISTDGRPVDDHVDEKNGSFVLNASATEIGL